jgi:hypothetical protein
MQYTSAWLSCDATEVEPWLRQLTLSQWMLSGVLQGTLYAFEVLNILCLRPRVPACAVFRMVVLKNNVYETLERGAL